MLLFNLNHVPYTATHHEFQNISCYCLTIEKTSFFNFFFQKNNDFITFFNVFTNRPFNFSLFRKTTYFSHFYYFFKKSLGKISKTSFPHVSWHFLLWIQSIKYATLIYKSIYKHKILSEQYSKITQEHHPERTQNLYSIYISTLPF